MTLKKLVLTIGIGLLMVLGAFIIGCQGEPGPAGPAGPTGPTGPTGPAGESGTVMTATATSEIQVEQCLICHQEIGAKHRADYLKYIDESNLTLTIDNVKSTKQSDDTYTTTIDFTIKQNGLPFIDKDKLPRLDQRTFYSVVYDSATRTYDNSVSYVGSGGAGIVAKGDGHYSVTKTGLTYAPEDSNGQVYAYIAEGRLKSEPAGHVILYDNVASAAMPFGDVATYQSYANVSACEKCHGTPYMKHGYRNPIVEGLSDFSSCKSCHYDTRDGHDQLWQILVNDPERAAEIEAGDALTDAESAQYAYKAKLMNDVHMSHAMEFPFPQSMANCATCHEGKLDKILTDEFFRIETCKSCHPVTGPEEGTQPNRAPALKTVMPEALHGSMDLNTTDCLACHKTGNSMGAPSFNQIHTGYNDVIYTPDGQKYSEGITVSIDDASMSGNEITFSFSAHGTVGAVSGNDIEPVVMIGLYGYDTKNMIVNGHERFDSNNNGTISRADGDLPIGEYEIGTEHPYFKTVSASPGAWTVSTDLSDWADMISDNIIRRVELEVRPVLMDENGVQVAINAPSRTFDLKTGAFDDDFFTDIVDVQNGCNSCHDALATTFHSPDRGGNIRVCRTCHVTLAGASHLELQSRSIDSFVHAIHSFQDFDIGDIDFGNPVEAMEYEEHITHTFPNFTIRNCEACHIPGVYNVPDQTKSLPGIQSASDVVSDREIQDVPSFVTGPASRACGGCHRAQFIKEDDAVGLAAFNRHIRMGGYLLENTDDSLLDTVIKAIVGGFEKSSSE